MRTADVVGLDTLCHVANGIYENCPKDEYKVKDAIKKYEKFLKDNGCKIIDVENWGLKKLAYSIQKKLSGFYALIDFEYDSHAR